MMHSERVRLMAESFVFLTDLYGCRVKVMLIAIGVAVGIAFVFSIYVIVYIAKRCRKKWKSRKGYYPRREKFAVCSVTSNPESLRSDESNFEHEVLYVPCDTQSESPFRRTQRVLRHESLREIPPTLFSRGSNIKGTGSWRREIDRSQREMNLKDRQRQNPEIRCIYPNNRGERTFRDASYVIHKVQAQYHGMYNNDMERESTTSQKTWTSEGAVVTITTISNLQKPIVNPVPVEKLVKMISLIQVDTSDLYACVQKAMSRLSEDRLDQIGSE